MFNFLFCFFFQVGAGCPMLDESVSTACFFLGTVDFSIQRVVS